MPSSWRWLGEKIAVTLLGRPFSKTLVLGSSPKRGLHAGSGWSSGNSAPARLRLIARGGGKCLTDGTRSAEKFRNLNWAALRSMSSIPVNNSYCIFVRAMELLVGLLLPPFDEAAASALQRRGLRYGPEWRTCAENAARGYLLGSFGVIYCCG